MLIPSIDLMGGRIVQLVQGSRKALEFDNFEEWIERFSKYRLVQLIDLDAAMGRGENRELVRQICAQLPCQVGGGIRSIDAAQAMLDAGARRVVLGSALISQGRVHCEFACEIASQVSEERLVFAVDSRGGEVAIQGWQESTSIRAADMMRVLEPYCGAFLYTHIDTEGLLQGIPLDVVRGLRAITSRQLIVAGGIRSEEEIAALDALKVDAVVGMAIYTGLVTA
jgi:phosphoribosylformimino-5-aminoimidazole carboxamide ribotide isomerase